mmetsp:Transcript_30629/g.78553  ORF Transcript_30629/g.78553 Transcript_30629/m.78553 type:complete len:298 (+) Transcript_30629:65-958(+)|eukprot:CAMPEP_0183421674 /NCGR_PEP_ID=MMETSP0370-20130417/27267_1 /TAXON_ID=268820 /ORGANISM="Peridinium aciculiferum, Strain PAER-2" /LENGTH=297 /DNA_ID=CAMNT_0025605693 /DNA_START=72 /DNA_END=965 /DNA_ORIENTATION=+
MNAHLMSGLPVRRVVCAGHVSKLLLVTVSVFSAVLLPVSGFSAELLRNWWGDRFHDIEQTGDSTWQQAKHKTEEIANSSEAHQAEEHAKETWRQAEELANSSAVHSLEKIANGTLNQAEQKIREMENSEQALEARRSFGHAISQAQNSSAFTEATAAMQSSLKEASALGHSAQAEAIQHAIANVSGKLREELPAAPANFTVPTKCLVAMAVGAGLPAAGGLSMGVLGFGVEGVEAKSVAAAWQSAIGDVESGSLFSKLQSLGASGYSGAIVLSGPMAVASFYFCETVNLLCNGCIMS